MAGAALSLAVSTMGAGILTLPSAFADGGVIPTSILLLFTAVLTLYSVDFIILSVDKLGLNSYEEITRELLGRRAEEFVRWTLLWYNFGSAVGYLVVMGDLFEPSQPMIHSYVWFLPTAKHTLLFFWAVVVLPMSCVPTVGALHMSSFLAILATSLISCMIVFRYFVPGPGAAAAMAATEPLWWKGRNALLALPVVMFSFDCQSLVFQIYANLDDMRRRTMFSVSIISLVVTTLIHGTVGLFGYLSNPTNVRENIISNYDPNVDPLFAWGYLIYAIPINLAFVLLLFPVRDSIFILWYGFSSASVATHVPRGKDFRRIVGEEEALEQREVKLLECMMQVLSTQEDESRVAKELTIDEALQLPQDGGVDEESVRQPLLPPPGPNGTRSAPVSRANYHATAGVHSCIYEAHNHRYHSTRTSHSGADCDTVQEIQGMDGNGEYPVPPPSVTAEAIAGELLATESTIQSLLHRKKCSNNIEVIPYRDSLLVSVAISTCCIAASLLMPGIKSVIALLGGLCSSTLCLVAPALFRMALHRNGLAPHRNRMERLTAHGMLAVGIIGGTLGTGVALYNMWTS